MKSLLNNDEVVVGKKKYSYTRVDAGADVDSSTSVSFDYTNDDSYVAASCFAEKNEIIQLLQSVVFQYTCNPSNLDLKTTHNKLAHVGSVLQKYREDSTLLDPHLNDLLDPLVQKVLAPHVLSNYADVSNVGSWNSVLSQLCSLIYLVSSICGYKALTSGGIFPHTVEFIRPVLIFASANSVSSEWESLVVFHLWMSVLIQVPFPLAMLGHPQLEQAVYDACTCDNSANRPLLKSRKVLLAKFFSRTDSSIDPIFERFLTSDDSISRECYLEAVSELLKSSEGVGRIFADSRRVQFLSHKLLDGEALSASSCKPWLNSVGLWVAAMLSKRITHSLDESLSMVELLLDHVWCFFDHKESTVREKVAKCLGRIVAALPIEYAVQLMDWIVGGGVKECLEEHTIEQYSLHTRLLTIGEFIRSRRDLGHVLPAALETRIITLTASCLDSNRFQNTVVSSSLLQQIKDASCAIVWSVSRKWTKQSLLSRVIPSVVPSLLVLCLFDREINLRRCAAGAIQELVGRSGEFLFGLKIVGVLDFWSVASLAKTYTEIPILLVEGDSEWPQILREKFTRYLQHNVIDQCDKMDKNVFHRNQVELAAEALAILLAEGSSEETIGQWIESAADTVLDLTLTGGPRFGLLLCLSHIVGACAKNTCNLSTESQIILRNLVPQMEKKRLYRNKRGDLVRVAAYGLLESILRAVMEDQFEAKSKFIIKCAEVTLEGVVHLSEQVRASAISALSVLSSLIAGSKDEETSSWFSQKISEIVHSLSSENMNVASRAGLLYALSALDDAWIRELLEGGCKCQNATYSESPLLSLAIGESMSWPVHWLKNAQLIDVDCRKAALLIVTRGLILMLQYDIAAENRNFENFAILSLIRVLIECTADFQSDKQSSLDMGAAVREVAIDCLSLVLQKFADSAYLNKEILNEILQCLVAHTGERIEKISRASVCHLRSLFVEGESSAMDFTTLLSKCIGVSSTLEIVAPTSSHMAHGLNVSFPELSRQVLKLSSTWNSSCSVLVHSLVNSSDLGFTLESLMVHFLPLIGSLVPTVESQYAANSLLNAMDETSMESRQMVFETIINFMDFSKNHIRIQNTLDWSSRVMLPATRLLTVLSDRWSAELISHASWVCDLMETALSVADFKLPSSLSVQRLKAVGKLLVVLWGGMVGSPVCRQSDLQKVIDLLSDKIFLSNVPIVRQSVAMDLVLVTFDFDQLIELLNSADWISERESDWRPQFEIIRSELIKISFREI